MTIMDKIKHFFGAERNKKFKDDEVTMPRRRKRVSFTTWYGDRVTFYVRRRRRRK